MTEARTAEHRDHIRSRAHFLEARGALGSSYMLGSCFRGYQEHLFSHKGRLSSTRASTRNWLRHGWVEAEELEPGVTLYRFTEYAPKEAE